MVRSGVSLGKIYRQTNRCRHWSTEHRAGSVRNYQRIGSCFHVIRQLTPLSFQHVVVHDMESRPAHIHDLFYDVVWKQCRGMNLLRTAHCLLNESAVALSIVLHKSISVDHHSSGRYRAVTDLIPASRGHERFHNADVLTHRAHQTLELIYRVAELLRGQDTKLSGSLGRSIRGLDPLREQGDRVSCLQVHTVLLKLLLHGFPHLAL